MCGILGAICCKAGYQLHIPSLRQSLTLLAHRGPDDIGVWWAEQENVFLGHRRLSILDLSPKGHQPMSDQRRMVWISYNGEIYNFAQLRHHLMQKGYHFRSATDTEVILHGYREYGPDIVRHLRGIFAFILYDTDTQTMIVARDPMGVKPLYYSWIDETLILSSELSPILNVHQVPIPINHQSLYEYLGFGKVYSPRTMFDGVYKFPSGCYGVIEPTGQMRIHRYWSAYGEGRHQAGTMTEEEGIQQVGALMQQSIQEQMISDRPIGAFLSGGVDSSAIVALMAQQTAVPVHTFTIGFQNAQGFDERPIAHEIARLFGTDHHEIVMTQSDLLQTLPTLIDYLDEPIADPTVIPIYQVTQAARGAGIPVLLSGDGVDELFCGYNNYLRYLSAYRYWRVWNHIPTVAQHWIVSVAQTLSVSSAVTDAMKRSALGIPLFVGSTGGLKSLPSFGPLLVEHGAYESVSNAYQQFTQQRNSYDPIEWLTLWGLQSEVEHLYMYRADRMGMANAVEIRVPFLDQRLIEFSLQLPQHLKYKGNTTKYLVKKAMQGILPSSILEQKKRGFCVPVNQWIRQELVEKIDSVLPQLQQETGAFSERFLQQILHLIHHPRPGRYDHGSTVWSLYMLSAWYQRWRNNVGPRKYPLLKKRGEKLAAMIEV